MGETFYDKKSGYYITAEDQRPFSKVERNGVNIDGQLIEIPWDNDGFTLCLDSFPSPVSSKHSKTTTSPLKRQWVSYNNQEKLKHNSLTTNYLNKQKPKAKKAMQKNKIMGDSFPYNNDEKFLDRMEEEQKQKGQVEYISPLMNSSILDESDIIYRSSTLSSNNNKKKSTINSSMTSNKQQSQISESGTLESWKVAKSPLTGMQSAVVTPIPQRSTTSSSPNYSQRDYFTPPTSIRSYHSIHVPKNADHLTLYSNSIHTNQKTRSYSQYFNPNFSRKKSRGPKSTGIFSKLLKNIKNHFSKE